MELQLKNIGMIKEANIKLRGLTVIAGENDTGKSTAGRAFYYAVENKLLDKNSNANSIGIGTIIGFGLGLLGGGWGAVAGATLGTVYQDRLRKVTSLNIEDNEKLANPILIETPYSLNNANYIKTTQLMASQKGLKFILGDHIIDLILQMSQTPTLKSSALYLRMQEIIDGRVYYDEERDNFFYYKESIDKELGMDSTATGIKMFGFLQILLLNKTIKEGTVLILDEPEVHLHPKWQLKYAEFLIELIKNGVNILVTSHSPYMIEALERYGEKAEINMDFYLAEDGFIDKVEDNNSKTLAKIFHKLSAPYETFNQMDSETLKGG